MNTEYIKVHINDLLKKGEVRHTSQLNTFYVYETDEAVKRLNATAKKYNYNNERGYYEKVIFNDGEDVYEIDLSEKTLSAGKITDIIHHLTPATRNQDMDNLNYSGTGYRQMTLYGGLQIIVHKLICCLTCGKNDELLSILTNYKTNGMVSLHVNHICCTTVLNTDQQTAKRVIVPIHKAACEIHPYFFEVCTPNENRIHGNILDEYRDLLANEAMPRAVTYQDSLVLANLLKAYESYPYETRVQIVDNYYKLQRKPLTYQFN